LSKSQNPAISAQNIPRQNAFGIHREWQAKVTQNAGKKSCTHLYQTRVIRVLNHET
jgi:hypothetical protein